MTYLATGLIVVWVAGLIFLLGRALNFSRLALNNPASDKPYWEDRDYFPLIFRRRSIFRLAEHHVLFFLPLLRRRGLFGLGVNPAKLTRAGRQYQNRAFRTEWITIAWTIAGIVPVVWAYCYLMAP